MLNAHKARLAEYAQCAVITDVMPSCMRTRHLIKRKIHAWMFIWSCQQAPACHNQFQICVRLDLKDTLSVAQHNIQILMSSKSILGMFEMFVLVKSQYSPHERAVLLHLTGPPSVTCLYLYLKKEACALCLILDLCNQTGYCLGKLVDRNIFPCLCLDCLFPLEFWKSSGSN